jgi:hypothetical protein
MLRKRPKELAGVKSIFKEIDPVTGDGEWVLPDDATPEQKKAYKEWGMEIENRRKQREKELAELTADGEITIFSS